jgi:hypothetical protein
MTLIKTSAEPHRMGFRGTSVPFDSPPVRA